MKQVLSSLPSTINYKRLNENYGKYVDYGQSDKLCDQLKKTFPERLGDYTSIEEFCEKLTEILTRFNTLSFLGSFEENKCIIVKYWMYDQLFNFIKGEYVIQNMRPLLDILSSIWKDYITDKKCNLDDAHMYSEENFNKIKVLFDYAQDYNTIKSAIKPPKMECSDVYMNYLDKGVQIYKEIKQDCLNNSDKPYCLQFKNLETLYNMDNLSNKICEIENAYLKFSPEVFDSHDVEDSETEEGETKSLGEGAQEMEYVEDEDTRDTEEAGDVLEDPARMLQLKQNVQLEKGPLYSQAESHTLSPSPFSTHDNIRKAVIPVSGGLLSLFMFYKFTPLGRRLRVFFSRNKLNSLNNNQVNDYLLTNKIEYGHPNSEINRHNIGYNPL